MSPLEPSEVVDRQALQSRILSPFSRAANLRELRIARVAVGRGKGRRQVKRSEDHPVDLAIGSREGKTEAGKVEMEEEGGGEPEEQTTCRVDSET
jgi:hypothetical protein